MLKLVLVLVVFLISENGCQQPPGAQFRVTRQWKYFNFTWPDEKSYLQAIQNHEYNPKNILIKRVKFYEDWYYLTLPRMKSGTTATLVKIPLGLDRGTAPPLEPYPSWEMNKQGNCNALQNVQSIEIDDQGKMWIIDLGATNLLERNPENNCPPKLIIHDIVRNRTIKSYVFPDEIVKSGSYLYDIVVDKNFAYITDNSAENPGIVVFSFKDNDSWKISHTASMSADQSAREFRINGIVINHPINIAPIALGPRLKVRNGRVVLSEERDVFYNPLSSFHLYSISSGILQDKSKKGKYDGIVRDWGVKAAQTDTMIMDNQGILYYSLLPDNSIGIWDSKTPFQTGQKIIARDGSYIQWLSSFSFDNLGNLSVVSTRMQNLIAYGEFNVSQDNFWMLSSHNGARSYVYDLNEYQPLPTAIPDYDTDTNSDDKLNVTNNNNNLPTPNIGTTTNKSFLSSSTTENTSDNTINSASHNNNKNNNNNHSTKNTNSAVKNSIGILLLISCLATYGSL